MKNKVSWIVLIVLVAWLLCGLVYAAVVGFDTYVPALRSN